MVHRTMLLEEGPAPRTARPGPARLRLEPAAALPRHAAAIADCLAAAGHRAMPRHVGADFGVRIGAGKIGRRQ